MNRATMSSRQFNQDVSRAKKLANDGPVFITDRGKPAHVLLSLKDYEALAGATESIVAKLSYAPAADIEFEPERVTELRSKDEDLF